jgi:hypothetical protein
MRSITTHVLIVFAASAAMLQAQADGKRGAQPGTTKVESPVTLTGCVRAGAPSSVGTSGAAGATPGAAAAGHFILTDIASPVGAQSGSDSRPAGPPASSSGAPAAAAASAQRGPQPVILEGAAVAPHLNQRVEVTGTILPISPRGETAPGAAARSGSDPLAAMQRLNVSAVVRVQGVCGPQ